MAGYIVPTADSIEEILGALYGPGLTVTPNDDATLIDRHVATYVRDDESLVAVCACDAAFVAYSGAALTMIPVDAANDMINSQDFTEIVLSNFHEVMNICSRLLMSDNSAHLRLDKTLPPDSAAQAVVTAESMANPAGFNIEIPQYGNGSLAFRIT